ncbi:MAG TPA: FAD-binding oxidoreductase [Myxococcaceae bacterium]|nr:FAD-binding oxidoreductase [Myxococcaceae bacterium]
MPGREICSEDLEALTEGRVLTRGLGRSYGDASLPPPGCLEVAGSRMADRLLAFDPQTGVTRAEAGLTLRELIRIFLPRGWFPPVTPGTAYVTLGGMVAADVHGKNHHRDGCFGEHVRAIRLRVADGGIIECSRQLEPELFRATLGGMGLTGHILEVEFALHRVSSPWMICETERVPDIDRFVAALRQAAPAWPFTMGWVDCFSRGAALGRGILYRGRWAESAEAPAAFPRPKPRVRIPFDFPEWVLGRRSLQLFNALKYLKQRPGVRRAIAHPEDFFYPLDMILDWNRMYGRRGMTQYQCVLPDSAGPGAARRFLEYFTSIGGACFLCVIKDCGAEGTGLLSFPRPGISLALDLPVGRDTQALIDALNEHVLREGGRIYLAKDAFTRAEHFRAMEPRLEQFARIRRRWDPQLRIRSAQSVRLFGDPP